jgi:hypothetical protein
MKLGPTDLEELRRTLRHLPRGNLLIIAERAAELVAPSKLETLLGSFVPLKELARTSAVPLNILDEVRRFHTEVMSGEYYEAFDVNSKNYTQTSKGTQAFIAEFDRLERRCIRAAKTEPRAAVRQAFELLFDLLGKIDQCEDEILFFADEGGSWLIGVNWRAVLPAYFRCVAETVGAAEYVQVVEQVITKYCNYERPLCLKAAVRVATAAQKAALRARRPRRAT